MDVWVSTGAYLQTNWSRLLSVCGSDYFILNVVGNFAVVNGLFFGLGGLYLLLDLTRRPSFLRKYKVQPGTNEPPDWNKLSGLLWQVFVNQILISGTSAIIVNNVYVWFNGVPDVFALPSIFTIVWQLIAFAIIEDALFFYSHWALHHRSIYRHVHKRHHEWTAPVALAASYAHPIEHVLSAVIPQAVGPVLLKAHPLTEWIWYSLVVTATLNNHSDYHFPLLPSPEMHDFHHLTFTQNFGTMGLLDYLHGTDRLFRSHQAYKWHTTLYGLKSARELYPDEKKSD